MKVNQKELAAILQVTPRRIQQMQQNESLPFVKEGRFTFYNLTDIIGWIKDQEQKNRADPLKTERTRLIKLQADKEEKLNAVLKQELLPFDLWMDFQAAQAKAIKQQLLKIPSTFKNQVPKVTNKMVKFLDKKIAESLNGLGKNKLPADIVKRLEKWVKEND